MQLQVTVGLPGADDRNISPKTLHSRDFFKSNDTSLWGLAFKLADVPLLELRGSLARRTGGSSSDSCLGGRLHVRVGYLQIHASV